MLKLFIITFLSMTTIISHGVEASTKETSSPEMKTPPTPSPVLSKNGHYLAYLYKTNDKEMIVLNDLEKGGQIGVPMVKESHISWFRFASDDMLLLSYASTAHSRIYRMEVTSTRLASFDIKKKKFRWLQARTKAREYTRLHQKKMAFQAIRYDRIVDFLPNEPDHVLQAIVQKVNEPMARGALNINEVYIRKLNIRNGKNKKFEGGRHGLDNYLTDLSNTPRLAWGYSSKQKKNIISYKSMRDGKWRIYKGPNAINSEILRFTKDPEVAYVLEKPKGGASGLYLVNLETGEKVKEIFTDPKHDIQAINFTQPPSVSGVQNMGKISSISFTNNSKKRHFISKYSSKIQAIVDDALPDTDNTIISQARKVKRFVIHSTKKNGQESYLLLDLVSGELNKIG